MTNQVTNLFVDIRIPNENCEYFNDNALLTLLINQRSNTLQYKEVNKSSLLCLGSHMIGSESQKL